MTDYFGKFSKIIGIRQNNDDTNDSFDQSVNILKEENRIIKDKYKDLMKENELLKLSIFDDKSSTNSKFNKFFKEVKTAFFSNERTDTLHQTSQEFKEFLVENMLFYNNIDEEEVDYLNNINITEEDWSANKELFIFRQKLIQKNYQEMMRNVIISQEFKRKIIESTPRETKTDEKPKIVKQTSFENKSSSLGKSLLENSNITQNASISQQPREEPNQRYQESIKGNLKDVSENNLFEDLITPTPTPVSADLKKQKGKTVDLTKLLEEEEDEDFNFEQVIPPPKKPPTPKHNAFDALLEDEIPSSTPTNINNGEQMTLESVKIENKLKTSTENNFNKKEDSKSLKPNTTEAKPKKNLWEEDEDDDDIFP